MTNKKIFFLPIFFTIFILLTSCTSMEFGRQAAKGTPIESKSEADATDDIKEYDLTYSYKVMGIPVTGKKSVIEAFYRDGKTDFIFVSFPKIGILKGSGDGKTFTSKFFTLKTLNNFFGYSNGYSDDNTNNVNISKERDILPKKLFSHFIKSNVDNKKVAISMGNYIFTTIDYGNKWSVKQLHWDVSSYQINGMVNGENGELIVFMNDKIMVSKDWGKNWKSQNLRAGKMKLQYISSIYDKGSKRLLISLKAIKEPDHILSKNSYLFFKNLDGANDEEEISEAASGLYYTENFGKNIYKMGSEINFPVSLWKYKNDIYFSKIYPTKLYDEKFSEDFYSSNLYMNGILNKSSVEINEYLKKKNYIDSSYLEIIDIKNPIIAKFEDGKAVKIVETNFDNVYYAIKSLENIDYLRYQKYDNNEFYSEKRDFFYDYNPYQMFMSWTNFAITSPILYTKFEDYYIRLVPDKRFLEAFFHYAFENEIKINSTNVFLRKVTDNRFFSPPLDPTDGFPVNFEYSKDGSTWSDILDEKHMRVIIDPLLTKRSGLYWYKNVEQKKSTRLELSFGFEEGASYFVYPKQLINYNKNYLLIILNYFSIMREYKDGYLIRPN